MKKIFFILGLIVEVSYGQNLGFNGSGFFENYNPEVEQYLVDMHQPFTIRVPGGAISKFHDPYNIMNGWGMSEASIRTWFEKNGFDEDGNGLEKWLRKTGEQPAHSYLDDLAALQRKFPEMQVIYVLNILNSSAESNMQAIRYLRQNKVNVVGVEAGNEVYGKYASFSEYINDFEPVFKMLKNEFPDIKKSLVAGGNISRMELAKWNDDLAAYTGDFDAISLHFYYTQRELSEIYNMIPLRSDYQPGKINPQLESAFAKAAEVLLNEHLFEDGITYATEKFRGKQIWITEWNTKPSEMLCNTIVNGAWQFKEMVTLRNKVKYLLVHNGVSPDKYGMISKTTKVDSESGNMLRRISYWSYILASEVQNGIPWSETATQYVERDIDGKTYIYFTNLKEAFNTKIEFGRDSNTSITIHYVTGGHLYSSAGAAGYMGKGSIPSYEVDGIKIASFNNCIPANAYGYILVEFK